MNNILMIEDDERISEVIEKYFHNRGVSVTAVYNGDDALSVISSGLDEYDLVLLDIMLPGTDGFTLCREIRRRNDIPVIFITARVREEDMLYGYDLGCDDYIMKPFMLSALYAKCEAIVKRDCGTVLDTLLTCGDISLDTRKLVCCVKGLEIELAPKEFEILRYLMSHQDWTIDRDKLLSAVWGSDFFGNDRIVDNHIKKLRKALGSAGVQIKTIIGRGYRLSEK
ncbi:MAG: response regulator transcription factor [Ruminococcus sp.]|nr:response regulator transcription factor [Ruminococcus sp.]